MPAPIHKLHLRVSVHECKRSSVGSSESPTMEADDPSFVENLASYPNNRPFSTCPEPRSFVPRNRTPSVPTRTGARFRRAGLGAPRTRSLESDLRVLPRGRSLALLCCRFSRKVLALGALVLAYFFWHGILQQAEIPSSMKTRREWKRTWIPQA